MTEATDALYSMDLVAMLVTWNISKESLEEMLTKMHEYLDIIYIQEKQGPTYFSCPAQLELFPSYGFKED